MPIVKKLRRRCKTCKKMFAPDGKFCKNCIECRDKRKSGFWVNQKMRGIRKPYINSTYNQELLDKIKRKVR